MHPISISKMSTTTAAATTEDKSKEPTKNIGKNRETLAQLISMARPEWPYIGASIATLSVTSSVTLLLPYSAGKMIDYSIAAGGDGVSPLILSSGLLVLTVLSATGVYWRSVWLNRAGNRITARLKQRLVQSMLHQDQVYHQSRSAGDLISVVSNDTWLVEEALTYHVIDGLRGSIMTIGSLTMLILTSPTLALISCCTLPPVFILTKRVGTSLSLQQEQVQLELGKSLHLAEQALRNITTVQESTAESYESRRYANATARAHSTEMNTAQAQARLEAISFCSTNAAVLGVLGYGATLVVQGTLTAGDLSGFILYSFLMAGNISNLSSLYGNVLRSLGAAQRIFAILHHVPSIRRDNASFMMMHHDGDHDPLQQVNVHQPDRDEISSAKQQLPIVHSTTTTTPLLVEFDNVQFRYPLRPDVPVLEGVSLRLEPGEVVALVGGSGSGKSTLATLLTRQFDIGTGMIRLDGMPLVDYDLQQLRRMIGVVSQQPAMFDGTIYDNILYGSWNSFDSVDDARSAVEAAAQMAHVMEFASELPSGLDTMIGGSQLSGGQKQRVALARAILKQSRLLILDEATSALDAKSEEAIHMAMDQLIRGRTVLSIAHRLSTIRMADRIVVLRQGQIVQTGSLEDLSSSPGPFLDLMRTQLQQQQEEEEYVG
jgi:ABC-type multidrug transport system fused ATPase/permease subunit